MLFLAVSCKEIQPIINFVKAIFTLIQWLIPIGLIIMGSIDLGKAVLSSDDKEIKQATSKLIKRAIAAVAIFFIVIIVDLIMGLVSDSKKDAGNTGTSSDSWIKCWNDPTGSGKGSDKVNE